MCIILTQSQLQKLSDKELCILFNKLSEQLYCAPPHSKQSRATHASLDNVRRAIAQRASEPKPPGF